MNPINKIKTLFFDSEEFFKLIKKETFKEAYIFSAVTYAILYLLIAIISLPVTIMLNAYPKIVAIGLFALGIIFNIIYAFILPLFNAGVNHLGVMIVKGKEGFLNTFKPSSYSIILIGIYSAVNAVFGTIYAVLNKEKMVALINPETITLATVPWGYYILMGILIIAMIIHTFIFEIKGISKFQKISKLKAFFAIMFIFVILLLLMIVFIILIIIFGIIIALIAKVI